MASSESSGWNVRQWMAGVLLIAIGHIGLVVILSGKGTVVSRLPSPEPHIRLVRGPAALGSSLVRSDPSDPTLFALASVQGFSGAAWLTLTPVHYSMTNAAEPFHWLSLRTEELADDFSEFVQTNLLSEDVIAGPLSPSVAQPNLPAPVMVPGTIVKLDGDLADRQLRAPSIPPQFSEPILTNSIVRVLVDAEGRTCSAALLSSCTVAAADQLALKFAKTATYSARPFIGPGKDRRCDVGLLTFQWARVRWEAPGALTAQR